jgi:hypothetical protein
MFFLEKGVSTIFSSWIFSCMTRNFDLNFLPAGKSDVRFGTVLDGVFGSRERRSHKD